VAFEQREQRKQGGEGSGRCTATWRSRGPGHGACSSWGGGRAQAGSIVQRQPGDGGAGSCTGEAGVEREGESRGEGWPVGRLTEWGPAVRGRGENGKWARLQFK
jgi:hypothetical protein